MKRCDMMACSFIVLKCHRSVGISHTTHFLQMSSAAAWSANAPLAGAPVLTHLHAERPKQAWQF